MFKLSLVVLVGALLAGTPTAGIAAENDFDNTKAPTGAVGARYIPVEDKRIKARVQLGESLYDYDLFGRDNFEYFPLQMGNGDYKIYIYENISGTKYKVAKSQYLKTDIKDPMSVYLASVQTVNWNTDMAAIKKARELTKGLTTDKEKIKAIYGYVVKNISYDYDKINKIDSTYVPNVDQILKDGKGICYDYAALLAAMLRSQNIPTKLIKGYSTLVKGYHAWNEIYLTDEKRWMTVDATYDSVLKAKAGKTAAMEKKASQYNGSKEY